TGTFTVPAGTHNYTVTDANGCSANTSVNVTEPTPLTATATAGSILCNGGTTTVTVSASGGTAPYTGTGTFTVSAGTHNYTVTDANGCTANTSVNVTQPTALTATATAGSILCNGGTTTVTVSASGGTAPYSGTGNFTVSAGTHNYTVTDANGCSANTSVNVTEPTPLTATATAGSILCNGGTTTVTVSASGGTAPYTGTGTFTVSAGTHNYTVTDANGCSANTSVNVSEPTALNISLNITNASCHGETNGSIIANANGGTFPYLYSWSNGQYGQMINNLAAGTYTVTVSDLNNCTAVASGNVNQPDQIYVFLSSQPAQCGGNGGGSIASIIGGTSPFNYIWSNGVSENNISNVSPGSYSITVIDSNNCTASQNVTINTVGSLNVSISVLNPISCQGYSDGSLTANVANGVEPYSYNWSNGINTSINNNLSTGTYFVVVTDQWGCNGSSSIILTEPTGITVNANINNVTCYGYSNGTISVLVSGGSGNYSYLWNTGSISSNISELNSGSYQLTIVDGGVCTSTYSFEVTQPEELILSADVHNISCFGNVDGGIILTATGGTSPYNYSIYGNNNILNGNQFNNLVAGYYTCYVEDVNLCSDTVEVIISEPASLTANFSYSNPSCIGNNNGEIIVNVTGGTEPYLFSWQNGSLDFNVITGLTEGIYNITITDNNNCQLYLPSITLTDAAIDCLVIPNAFTPNGDGINDTWIIENLNLFPSAYVYVYNRWGQELWVGRPGNEWDGTFEGKLMPAGTYLYIIELFDGTTPYKGTVTIIY
ncbi:MAG TPA: gliding motility-associated C-terminal domain-containing protein, partial [Bacteroidales bacterium]|nr:gliding motility-associated C-terminal domain-containing protein [Bacteroidales bacterium]